MRLDYIRAKFRARHKAMLWQMEAAESSMSYGELAEAQARFEKLGRRYGLTREFRINGII